MQASRPARPHARSVTGVFGHGVHGGSSGVGGIVASRLDLRLFGGRHVFGLGFGGLGTGAGILDRHVLDALERFVGTADAQAKRECTEVDEQTGEQRKVECLEPVTVRYDHAFAEVDVTLETQIAVVDLVTGEPVGETRRSTGHERTEWAEGLYQGRRPVDLSNDRLVLPTDLVTLASAPAVSPNRADIAHRLLDEQAVQIARFALDVIDVEAPWSDPISLER